MDNPMKPPPGAMMTAVPVAVDGSGRYVVSVGVLTLITVSMPPERRLVSGCFHCSDPGATPGQRLMIFVAMAGVGACSGLAFWVACALLVVTKKEAASTQSAMKNILCVLLMAFVLVTGRVGSARLLFPGFCSCIISPARCTS